jgi:hypothetical protein
MNKEIDIRNPYQLPKVILAPVSDEMQLDENLEPPFIRVRDTNSQYMQLDTSKNTALDNPSEAVIPLNRSMPRVNRIKIVFFATRYFSPNINPRNNVFNFINNGVQFTAILAPDQNLIGIARYDALALAMSTAIGLPGAFTASASTNFANTYTISGGLTNSFRFLKTSNGIINGRYLWGFNERNYNVGTDSLEQTLTSYSESYSRYIDVSSFELTQYTKIDTAGTDIPAETVFRFFLTDVVYGQSIFTGFTQSPSLNYDRSRAISSVDLQLLDEFHQLLYVPTQHWGSSLTYIVMVAEM